jgi:hypothetical protein
MDTTKPLLINPELARHLQQAAAEGQSLSVTIENRRYRLSIIPEPERTKADMWEGYDPEKVREAVRRSSELPYRAEPDDLDPLIAEIRAQRDQTLRDSGR